MIEISNHTLNGFQLSIIELKSLFLLSLYEYSTRFGSVCTPSFVDFVNNLNFRLYCECELIKVLVYFSF